jgi:hypothetical protein
MGAAGSAVLDFGATPTDEASVVVTGQSGIAAESHVEAFFMRESTAGNTVEDHEQATTLCRLVCGNIVPGTGFTIYAHSVGGLGVGTFAVRWVWA